MQQSCGLLPRPVQKLVATMIFRQRRKMHRVPSDPRAKRRNGTLWDAHFRRRRKMPRVPSDLPVNIKPLSKPSAALVLVASSGYPGAPAARLNTHRTYPSALFSCGRLFGRIKLVDNLDHQLCFDSLPDFFINELVAIVIFIISKKHLRVCKTQTRRCLTVNTYAYSNFFLRLHHAKHTID